MGEEPKYVLRLKNHTLDLLLFESLHNQMRTCSNLYISLDQCVHDYVFIQYLQTRCGDEAFTSIYRCSKCNIQIYKS